MKKFTIKKSLIAGQGAFARQLIQKNEVVGLAFVHQKHTGNPDDDYQRTELGKFTNHSTTPNLSIKSGRNTYYIAVKNIKPSEELTVNYQHFDWEGKRDF